MAKGAFFFLGLCVATASLAGPAEDLTQFQSSFRKTFPAIPFSEFANGAYALDAEGRKNWEAIEEFPPYTPGLEDGKKAFETPFANKKTLADCLPNRGIGIRQTYPRFDTKMGQVRTLEDAINDCRVQNGEKPYVDLEKGEVANISAYLASTSRGKPMDISIPKDPRALAAYEKGKRFFYAKRGQLNFSCADCHVKNAGKRLRSDTLSPALGHGVGFPVYRSAWGFLGTLHHRYKGCNEQVRAKSFPAQSEEYRDLEYFQAYMNNGVPVSGPSARK